MLTKNWSISYEKEVKKEFQDAKILEKDEIVGKVVFCKLVDLVFSRKLSCYFYVLYIEYRNEEGNIFKCKIFVREGTVLFSEVRAYDVFNREFVIEKVIDNDTKRKYYVLK